MTDCKARTGSDGQHRCSLCGIVADADDRAPCPRQCLAAAVAGGIPLITLVPPLAPDPFVSALAPRAHFA